ncbi:hypothetical protein D9758_000863 [Tetrapyrgos nigripes]|uniref:Uncharacterized protein n=1 Tax=Tetrapyrgos nigripes TaxID=182062 RepID=A0A8H5LXQ4_9AGAR|nr:hypothetical protein D9758_000863 [Tetrapyrgos nigripes]
MDRDSFAVGEAATLLVTVTYGKAKASEFLPGNLSKAIPILRKDLTKLGLVQPKKQSIRIHMRGVVQFSWVTTIGSILENSLEAKLNPDSKRAVVNSSQKILKEASIMSLQLKYESSSYCPDDYPVVGKEQEPSYYGEEPPEYHSRPPSYEPLSQPIVHSLGIHPVSDSVSSAKRPVITSTRYDAMAIRSTPSVPMTRTHSQAAKSKSQDSAESSASSSRKARQKQFQSQKKLYTPTGPTTPPATSAALAVAPSIIRTRSQARLNPEPDSDVSADVHAQSLQRDFQRKASQSQSKTQTQPQPSQSHPLPAKPVFSVDCTSPSSSSSYIPPPPRTPPYSYPDHPFTHPTQPHFYPEYSYVDLAIHQSTKPSMSPFVGDRSESISNDVDVEKILLGSRDPSAMKLSPSPNRAYHYHYPDSLAPSALQIRQENQELRDQVAALSRKVEVLEKALETEKTLRMSATSVLPTPPASQTTQPQNPYSEREDGPRHERTEHWVRLQGLQQLEYLEKELCRERIKRIEAESLLEDVEKECREPFVVPALMEAFLMVRDVGTSVLDGMKVDRRDERDKDEGERSGPGSGLAVKGHGYEYGASQEEILDREKDREMLCKVEEVDDAELESLKRKRGSDDEDDLERWGSEFFSDDEEPVNTSLKLPPRKRFVPEDYAWGQWEHS